MGYNISGNVSDSDDFIIVMTIMIIIRVSIKKKLGGAMKSLAIIILNQLIWYTGVSHRIISSAAIFILSVELSSI